MSGKQKLDGFKVCSECGSFYLNFCLHCKKRGLDERVWEIMERNGLNEEELIRILASHIASGNFPALSKAINMRDLMPAERAEVNIGESGEIRDAKERLGNLLSRLTTRRREE